MTDLPQTDSTPAAITSDQQGCHPELAATVEKHRLHPWRKPVPGHTRAAFDRLLPWLEQHRDALVLDDFCGTGMSTAALAGQYPGCGVLGVDQSAHRLGRHQGCERSNYRLLQAECESLWRLLVEAGITLEAHYLLYPNPWPKAAQLKRRIHGHPAFPLLADLGGSIELRSNWETYVREFAAACALIGRPGRIDVLPDTAPITLFERKYAQRGQTLWQFRAPAPTPG